MNWSQTSSEHTVHNWLLKGLKQKSKTQILREYNHVSKNLKEDITQDCEVVRVQLQVGDPKAQVEGVQEMRKNATVHSDIPKNHRADEERPRNDSSSKTNILKLTRTFFLSAKQKTTLVVERQKYFHPTFLKIISEEGYVENPYTLIWNLQKSISDIYNFQKNLVSYSSSLTTSALRELWGCKKRKKADGVLPRARLMQPLQYHKLKSK